MKKLFIYLMMFMLTFSVMSCVTETYAQVQATDEMYDYTDNSVSDAHLQVVITYGTPYIIDDIIYYYFYNGRYYYPYYYNSYFYLRVYTHPLRHYPRYWRPVPRAHWYHNGAFHRPYRSNGQHHPGFGRGGHNPRPHDGNINRPHGNRQSSTRVTAPHPSIGKQPTGGARNGNVAPRTNTNVTPRSNMGGARPNTSVAPRQTAPSSGRNTQVFRGGSTPSVRQSSPAPRGGGFGGARPSGGGSRGSFGGRR